MSMIMALDEDFKFLYKDKDDDDEDNICALTVRKGHAITFTNQAGPTIQVKQCTVCLHTL